MKPRSLVRLYALCLLLLLLVGCAPIGGATAPAGGEAAWTHTVAGSDAAAAASDSGRLIDSGKLTQATIDPWLGADIIADEVVVYGDQKQIDDLVAALPLVEISDRIALGFVTPGWEARLYQSTGGTDAAQLAALINEQAQQRGTAVSAEPNLVMVSSQGAHVFGSRGALPLPGPKEGFATQWIWGKAGINLPADQPWRGVGVTVGIFDNCPASQPAWVDEMHSSFSAQPGVGEVGEHGAGVAALIDQVASDAKLKLYCVLDPAGYGRLSDLIAGLAIFVDQHPQENGRSVINLSLGVSGDPKQSGTAGQSLLQITLDSAHKLGFVNVAAAGNQGNASAMNSPAAYGSVIGVAGHTHDRQPSNFTNLGEIAAPAGGNLNADELAKAVCADQLERFVITPADSSPTGHLCWQGTSFATPLVSGAAALLLEKDPAMTAVDVAAKLYGTAEAGDPVFGAGILDVTQALQ